MLDIVRNMMRRKGRTSLTVLGIVIGVFALTVMGSMAEKMNMLVGGGLTYYSGHATVVQKGGAGFNGGPLSTAVVQRVEKVPGVEAVIPLVSMPLKTDVSAGSFGLPDSIDGSGPNMRKYEKFPLTAASGTMPPLTKRGVISVGSSIAREYKLQVGDTFNVRGQPFTVAAILDATMTAPDSSIGMSLADAQMLYLRALPPMLRHGLKASEIATALNAYPKPGVTGDQLATNISRAGIPGVKVVSPTDAKKALEQVSSIFNLIVMGSAIIALVVGALSVINTMAMAVAERVKEIGLKKAIGARTTQVLRDFLTEALLMGFLGGVIGLGLGSLLVSVINGATASTGNEVFAVTTRLAIGTVVFASFLGAAAGLLPALRAARLNPVDALRSE